MAAGHHEVLAHIPRMDSYRHRASVGFYDAPLIDLGEAQIGETPSFLLQNGRPQPCFHFRFILAEDALMYVAV